MQLLIEAEAERSLAGALRGLPHRLRRLGVPASPRGLEDALPGLTITAAAARQLERALIVGSGSAGNAALLGRRYLERLAGLPTAVAVASEFAAREATVSAGTLVVWAVDGSRGAGMSALAAASGRQGHPLLPAKTVPPVSFWSVDSVEAPSAAACLEPDPCRFAVVALALYLLACRLGRLRGLGDGPLTEALAPVERLPELMERALAAERACARAARWLRRSRSLFLLGRGPSYAAAQEGALQMKLRAGLHAEAYPAAELKHGPIALVDEELPVIAVAPRDDLWGKMLANVAEVRSRDGWVLAIGTEGDEELRAAADQMLTVPEAPPLLSPLLTSVPLQLLALHLAAQGGERRNGQSAAHPQQHLRERGA